MSPRGQLAEMIQAARRVVIFTGAGISTESGIPDFRSPGGVWSKMKPIYFQEFVGSEDKRREAWTRTFAGSAGWTGREPNAGHYAVARLVASGKASAVITQNVDNLHQTSGMSAEHVVELHGNTTYATCLDCAKRYELSWVKERYTANGGRSPDCACGGFIKTATVSFGQAMPEAAMRRAQQLTDSCDLFIAIGSSLVVWPAAKFPLIAKRNGAQLVIVNREETEFDDIADLVLRHDIGSVFAPFISH
jgi:NAD-dependent deacetylase